MLFVQERSFEVNQGCSLLALDILAREKGYELVCATNWNKIFVRNEYLNLFGIADNSLDARYQPKTNGRIFHGYDGTIHVVGMPYLLWHDVEVSSTISKFSRKACGSSLTPSARRVQHLKLVSVSAHSRKLFFPDSRSGPLGTGAVFRSWNGRRVLAPSAG